MAKKAVWIDSYEINVGRMSLETRVDRREIEQYLKPEPVCGATTAVATKGLFLIAKTGSEAERLAFEKWIELETNHDELLGIFRYSISNYPDYRRRIIRKLARFYRKKKAKK